MKQLRLLITLTALLAFLGGQAQSRSCRLTVSVESLPGDNLAGQTITLRQADYGVGYGSLTLDADGKCALNAYTGNHSLEIVRDGFDKLSKDFAIPADATEFSVDVTLAEKSRAPFAITALNVHDAFSGNNGIHVSWNTEAPAFADDFESYEAWAVDFAPWTGIDGDKAAAAPIVGNYPNRGVAQYAQIINPLTVEPTWWYDYPILRPYSGQQYVGFTRTSTGVANDDWLISPAFTVGEDNVLSFLAKAADQYPERFMVYVTEVVDNPGVEDFIRIDQGNYEAVDYKGWHQMVYDLADWAGKEIKFAIRYIADANRYGAFMLMLDDVYVGQPNAAMGARVKSRRVPARSAANPYEEFEVYLDGTLVGTTPDYEFNIENVSGGQHTVGIRSIYRVAKSDIVEVNVVVPEASDFARLSFNVSADSRLNPDGTEIQLVNLATAETYTIHVVSGHAEIPSLPLGEYAVKVEEGAFAAFEKTVDVKGDMSVDISLTDNIIDPYNITHTFDEDGNVTLKWNQILGFSDSFEEYEDFATGAFGEWLSVDNDGKPVYPIALGDVSNVVSFPGAGTAANPMPLAPIVFNPWNTVPAMLPTDAAIAANSGDKTVAFFSTQLGQSDKWLISPEFEVNNGYVLRFWAKAYTSFYPESFLVNISTDGPDLASFTTISTVEDVPSSGWAQYEVDLSSYEGRKVRVAFQYITYDGMLAQIDDVTVEPQDGVTETVDYGNVDHFEIFLDGKLHGTSATPSYAIADFPEGTHEIGIKAVYLSGESKTVSHSVTMTSGVSGIPTGSDGNGRLFDLWGNPVTDPAAHGVYILMQNGKSSKVIR